MTHEAHRRQTIYPVLTAAGWHVCDVDSANLRAATGVAIREFLLNAGSGFADYLLCVKGKACGVIEAKKSANYKEMRKVSSGGVQPNLNLRLVRAVCVPLPPVAEQMRITAAVDRQMPILHGVEADVDANLQSAQALRQSTLSKAFVPGGDGCR
jgi:hypothetical protein